VYRAYTAGRLLSGAITINSRHRATKAGPGELLKLIRASGPVTRADLAARTGLGRASVAQRVDALLGDDLIREAGGAPPTRGRPPLRLVFNAGSGLTLAADVGAIQARLALTDLAGQPRAERRVELSVADGPEPVLAAIRAGFERLLAETGAPRERVRAIGIGVPGPVEHATGQPVSPPIMPGWDGYSIPERLRTSFEIPVLVDNDVNIMALGEHATGWRQRENLLFVKVGTGIGCGIIVNGQIHRGAEGAAGDIGHVRVAGYEEAVCECGNLGCLEAVAGGRALARAAREQGLAAGNGRDVVALAREQQPAAVRLVRDAGRRLGQVLAGFVNGLNPSVIVVGGDVAEAGEQLFAGLREVIYQRSTTLATRGLMIVPSALGARAGVVGAALMASEHVLDPAVVNARVGTPVGT
jgi:predicted NBD/HSP70 family sugar kinase